MGNNRQKTMIVAILIVAVCSLSIGFAAFSSTLRISSIASVSPDASTFSVKFSTSKTSLVESSVTPASGIGGNAIIDNSGTIPTIKDLKAYFTAPGESVVYEFYAYNSGEYDAYLNSIVFGEGKSCNSSSATPELLNQACNSIRVKVNVEGIADDYLASTTIQNHMLQKKTGEKITVTIEYEQGGGVADGSFSVTFGTISLAYSTLEGDTSGGSGGVIPSGTLCTAATSDTVSKVGTVPTGNYNPGEEYNCEVASGDYRTFFVLSTNKGSDGSVESVNLIMNNNINPTGQPSTNGDDGTIWLTSDDYQEAGGQFQSPMTDLMFGSDKGPVTAMKYINNATLTTWTKVPTMQASINTAFTESKARLPKLSEMTAVGCKEYPDQAFSCPAWLVENINIDTSYGEYTQNPDIYTGFVTKGPHYGYWWINDGSQDEVQWGAPAIQNYGGYEQIGFEGGYSVTMFGVRPVITVSTSDLG